MVTNQNGRMYIMKKIICLFVLLALCLSLIGCNQIKHGEAQNDPTTTESTNNPVKVTFPILVTSFPTSLVENSYVIILSEDGTIETYWGIRRAYEIEESDYTYNGADWFAEIDAYKMSKLTEEEMAIIYDLFQQVPFSSISAPRGFVTDGREQLLFMDYTPFYTYGFEADEDASLLAFVDQIVAYSPIEVVNIGWA
jgi:hypothetical protein